MDRVSYIQQRMSLLLPDHHLHTLLFCFIQNFLGKNLNGKEVFFLDNPSRNSILSFEFIKDIVISCYVYFE